MSDTEQCGICGVIKDTHRAKEIDGRIQHKFAGIGGKLEAVDQSLRPVQGDSQARIIIAAQPDVALRRLLVDMGVITPQQFNQLTTPMIESAHDDIKPGSAGN